MTLLHILLTGTNFPGSISFVRVAIECLHILFVDILQRIRSGKLHHPELPLDKGVPENVRNIVALCLAGNPEQRPSFSEVRFRLRAAGWITYSIIAHLHFMSTDFAIIQ
jgi:hypothetical protein